MVPEVFERAAFPDDSASFVELVSDDEVMYRAVTALFLVFAAVGLWVVLADRTGRIDVKWPIWLALLAVVLLLAAAHDKARRREQKHQEAPPDTPPRVTPSLGPDFWWRFFPLFFAVTTPPLGVIAGAIALAKGPTESRPWNWGAVAVGSALTLLMLVFVTTRPAPT